MNSINIRHLSIYMTVFAILIAGCSKDRKQETWKKHTETENIKTNNKHDNSKTTLKLVYDIPWGIPEDGFNKITTDIINTGKRNDGFVYIGGMKLKQDGMNGFFDIENHLEGIQAEFSDFVIGEAPDYSDTEKRRINDIMKKHNEKIAFMISAITEIAGAYQVCGFDEDDTDFYFENGTNILAEWMTDTGRITLLSSNKSNGTGCRMHLILERQKK